MNCPKHFTSLDRSMVHGQETGRCPDCNGIWVPGPAVDTLLGPGELLKLRSLCSARLSDLICPHDHKQLGETRIAGVTLDLCPTCNGLWLDHGELEKLRARPRMKQSAMAGALRAEGESRSLGVLDVVSEGLLAVLLTL